MLFREKCHMCVKYALCFSTQYSNLSLRRLLFGDYFNPFNVNKFCFLNLHLIQSFSFFFGQIKIKAPFPQINILIFAEIIEISCYEERFTMYIKMDLLWLKSVATRKGLPC